MLRFLFAGFPRELGTPRRRLVHSGKDFMKFIELNNGKTNCYTSIYSFEKTHKSKGVYETAKLDKVYFDFDDIYLFDQAVALQEWGAEKGAWSLLIYSGRGWHVCLLAKRKRYKYPSNCLRNFQIEAIEELGLKCDPALNGDLGRLIRIPGTMNMKSKTYCTPIRKKGVELLKRKGPELAFKLGKKKPDVFVHDWKQHTKLPRIDLSPWDKQTSFYGKKVHVDDVDIEEAVLSVPTCKEFPPDLKSICGPTMGHQARARVISYIYQAGYNQSECTEFLRNTLEPKRFKHCMRSEKQIQRIYKKGTVL